MSDVLPSFIVHTFLFCNNEWTDGSSLPNFNQGYDYQMMLTLLEDVLNDGVI